MEGWTPRTRGRTPVVGGVVGGGVSGMGDIEEGGQAADGGGVFGIVDDERVFLCREEVDTLDAVGGGDMMFIFVPGSRMIEVGREEGDFLLNSLPNIFLGPEGGGMSNEDGMG
jgi:hypothetical protein